MSDVTFSIVICNHDYGRFVGEAIQSCLDQDYPKALFEIIVVDDGSSDESREVIARFAAQPNFTGVLQENRGQAAAFAAGIERARHDFICFLDSDDLFLPGKLGAVARRVAELSPIPEHFFLCHDAELHDQQRGETLAATWFQIQGLVRYGPVLHLDQTAQDYPFVVPCGQVMSRACALRVAQGVVAWEWRQGADSVYAHSALILATAVHYLPAALARYRIHGESNFGSIIDGRFVPRNLWTRRWPKLLYYLERLVDTLELDARQRASRLAHLKRLERMARSASMRHRFAEPTMSFVLVGAADDAQLVATLEACVAQTHPKTEIVLIAEEGATPAELPERLRSQVRQASAAADATQFKRCASGYQASTGDYVCFLRIGDIPDDVFAERHLFVHRYGSMCNLTSCDLRVINQREVLLHSNLYGGAGLWQQTMQIVPPLSTPLREWIFPPLSGNVFRRSRFLDRLFDDAGAGKLQAFGDAAGWLLPHFAHNLTGSVRINECLLSVRVEDAMGASYGRLFAPVDASGAPIEPDVDACAELLFDYFCRNQDLYRYFLPPRWHARFVAWITDKQSASFVGRLRQRAAAAGAEAALALLPR